MPCRGENLKTDSQEMLGVDKDKIRGVYLQNRTAKPELSKNKSKKSASDLSQRKMVLLTP